MSISKRQQEKLRHELGDRNVTTRLLDELQAMRDKYNSLLAKLDQDAGITDTNYVSDLKIENIRE